MAGGVPGGGVGSRGQGGKDQAEGELDEFRRGIFEGEPDGLFINADHAAGALEEEAGDGTQAGGTAELFSSAGGVLGEGSP